MTLEQARQEIMFASQNCEEIGLGMQPLSHDDLSELESQAVLLIGAIALYRAAVTVSPVTEVKP
jgi:hypothetical protein